MERFQVNVSDLLQKWQPILYHGAKATRLEAAAGAGQAWSK